jgi:signal transduction histidine kinase
VSNGAVTFGSDAFAAAFAGALASSNALAVIVVDPSLAVHDANPGAKATLGDALRTGAPLEDVVDARDVATLRKAIADRDGDGGPYLLRSASDAERPDGALLVSMLSLGGEDGSQGAAAGDAGGAHEGGGTHAGFVLIGRSATEDLEREARILRARRWEIIGQLTSGVAHDLNNRLSTVTTFSDLMLGDADPESQDAEDLAEIKQAGLDSATITRKLDLFAGGHAGGAVDASLPDVVRGFEKLIRRFLGSEITLETELDDTSPRVAAPPIRIEEMLIALVANARDAMADGGTLTLRARPSTPSEELAGAAVLEVCDTGANDTIPPLERALEPFFSSKPHGIGSGLGLGTVHGIATELGGVLRLAREHGATRVTLILPGIAEEDAGEPDQNVEGGRSAEGAPTRVGLVEPGAGARAALTRGLERDGHRVVAGPDVSVLDQGPLPVDAVIADVPDRPGAGAELVQTIRERSGEVPVVLLRRRASPRATLPGTPGVVELAKPVDLARIRSALLSFPGPGTDARPRAGDAPPGAATP